MSAVPDDHSENRGGGKEQLFLPELPTEAAGEEAGNAGETCFEAAYVKGDSKVASAGKKAVISHQEEEESSCRQLESAQHRQKCLCHIEFEIRSQLSIDSSLRRVG